MVQLTLKEKYEIKKFSNLKSRTLPVISEAVNEEKYEKIVAVMKKLQSIEGLDKAPSLQQVFRQCSSDALEFLANSKKKFGDQPGGWFKNIARSVMHPQFKELDVMLEDLESFSSELINLFKKASEQAELQSRKSGGEKDELTIQQLVNEIKKRKELIILERKILEKIKTEKNYKKSKALKEALHLITEESNKAVAEAVDGAGAREDDIKQQKERIEDLYKTLRGEKFKPKDDFEDTIGNLSEKFLKYAEERADANEFLKGITDLESLKKALTDNFSKYSNSKSDLGTEKAAGPGQAIESFMQFLRAFDFQIRGFGGKMIFGKEQKEALIQDILKMKLVDLKRLAGTAPAAIASVAREVAPVAAATSSAIESAGSERGDERGGPSTPSSSRGGGKGLNDLFIKICKQFGPKTDEFKKPKGKKQLEEALSGENPELAANLAKQIGEAHFGGSFSNIVNFFKRQGFLKT